MLFVAISTTCTFHEIAWLNCLPLLFGGMAFWRHGISGIIELSGGFILEAVISDRSHNRFEQLADRSVHELKSPGVIGHAMSLAGAVRTQPAAV